MTDEMSPQSEQKDKASSYSAVRLPKDHAPVKTGKVGVLLVNLGTPEGTSYGPMRKYLGEFLSDKRVIETPRWLWYPILHGIILTVRPGKSGKLYEKIWNHELNESPLRTITRSQADKLGHRFDELNERVHVDWAMRYGQPSIQSRLQAMKDNGCDRILIYPLYPQYSASTTATVNDEVFKALLKMRWQPAIRTVPPYHDDPIYIDALAASIHRSIEQRGVEPEVVLASFHGVPQSYLTKGDPYHCQCQKTARLLRERLGWDETKFRITFQSRFGPEEWLKPYTDETVKSLAENGVKDIAVLNPGFVADCLETLEEIAGEAAEIFHEHGGHSFTHVPCLNDSDLGMGVIEAVVQRELSGWI